MALDKELGFYDLDVYSTAALQLKPAHVLGILERASNGYFDDFIAWAKEIRKRDLHYRSLLEVRYNAVIGLDVTIESATGSRQDVATANAVRDQIVEKGEFRDLLLGLLDGIEKGFSCVELIWNPDRFWWPSFKHRDQRYFTVYQGHEVGLKGTLIADKSDLDLTGMNQYIQGMAIDFIPLPQYKFAVHIPSKIDNIPMAGLAYSVMFHHVIKMFALQAFVGYTENFGTPYRIGKYSLSASPQDIDTFKSALRTLGQQASAVVPETMDIEMLATSSSGSQPFQDLIHVVNDEISKLVLGQVRTMDESSVGLARASESQGRDQVRQDILESDKALIEETINRHVVKPFVELNYGMARRVPVLKLHLPEDNDTALIDNIVKLSGVSNAGFAVGQEFLRDKLGIPDPVEGEMLLGETVNAPDEQSEAQITERPTEQQPLDEIAAEDGMTTGDDLEDVSL